MTINFALLAFDQIVNHAAHIHYMFGGQVRVPLVVRMPQGAGHQLGPTHSHCLEAMFLHVPGLLVAVPATPADAKGLLKTAIRDENPVIFIEHESLYGVRGEVPEDEEQLVGFGRARIAREGADVTIVGVSRMALTAERAAETLAKEHGVEAEVIDPRTLRRSTSTRSSPRCQDQPLRRRRGGLAARRRRREPGGADRRARLRRPRRARRACHRRRCADALLKASRGHRLSARAADRPGRARDPRLDARQRTEPLMAEIVMPRLSDTMEEGTILRWLEADGEQVRRGEELVEIETDKATMTYESDQEGVLQIVAAEGDTLPVGEVIAQVGRWQYPGTPRSTVAKNEDGPAQDMLTCARSRRARGASYRRAPRPVAERHRRVSVSRHRRWPSGSHARAGWTCTR